MNSTEAKAVRELIDCASPIAEDQRLRFPHIITELQVAIAKVESLIARDKYKHYMPIPSP